MSEGHNLAWPEERSMEALRALENLALFIQPDFNPSRLGSEVVTAVVKAIKPDIACYYEPTASGKQVIASGKYPDDLWQQPKVEERFFRRDIGSGAIKQAVQTKRLVSINDVQDAEKRGEIVAFTSEVGSELVTPVFMGETLCGLIIISKYEKNAFGIRERGLCQVIGNILGIAYRMARDKASQNARTSFLREIASLNTGVPEQVAARTLELIGTFLPVKFASFWLYNASNDTLVIQSYHPILIGSTRVSYDSMDKTIFKTTECLSGETVRTGRTLMFEDIQQNNRNANAGFAREHDLTWFISFPIASNDKITGIVNVYPTVPKCDINPADLEATSVAISQASQALELAILRSAVSVGEEYRKLGRTLKLRLKDDAWNTIAQHIAKDMMCEACSIFQLDPDHGDLVLRGSTGLQTIRSFRNVRYRVGEGLTGQAFQKRTPVIYHSNIESELNASHIGKHKEVLKDSQEAPSILYCSMIDDSGTAVGVMRCVNKTKTISSCGRFTSVDIVIAEHIARAIAVWLQPTKREKRNDSLK